MSHQVNNTNNLPGQMLNQINQNNAPNDIGRGRNSTVGTENNPVNSLGNIENNILQRSNSIHTSFVNNTESNRKNVGNKTGAPISDNEALLIATNAINGNDEKLGQLDKKLFIGNLILRENNLFNKKETSKHLPALYKLQNLASICPLDFKKKCAVRMKDSTDYRTFNGLYKAAQSPEEKAYVDLMVAYSISKKAGKVINKYLPENYGNVDINGKHTGRQDVIDNIKALIGNLIASSTEEVDNANNMLVDYMQEIVPRLTNNKRANQMMTGLLSIASEILQNKKGVTENLKKVADNFSSATENMSNFDIDKFNDNSKILFSTTINAHAISKECGQTGIYVNSREYLILLNQYKTCVDKIESFNKIKNEIEYALDDSSLNGETIDSLKKKVQEQGFNNKKLLDLIDNHSNSTKKKLEERISKLFHWPDIDGATLANELNEMSFLIERHLNSAQKTEIIKKIADGIKNLNVQDNPNKLPEIDNKNALIKFMSKVEENETLQNQFTSILKFMFNTRYDFTGIIALKEVSNGDEKTRIDTVVEVLEQYASALENKDEALNFISNISKVKITTNNQRFTLQMMLEPFRMHQDLKVSQNAMKMHQTLVILNDSKEIQEKIANNPNAYDTDTADIKKIVDKLNSKDWSSLTTADLTKLANLSVKGTLPELAPYWNTIVDSAYHSHILDEANKDNTITQAPSSIHSITAQEVAPENQVDNNNKLNKIRTDFINTLDDSVKEKLNDSNMGLVRKKSHGENAKNTAEKLNFSLNDYRALKTVLTGSRIGKQILATKELKEIAKDLKITESNEDIEKMSPEELIKVGVDKSKVIQSINSQFKIPQTHTLLQQKLNTTICLPTISKLQSKQGIKPNESVKGENVAVTLSILKDNLIDRLEQLDPDILRLYGINDLNQITLTKEEIEHSIAIQKYQNQCAQANLNNTALPQPPVEDYPNDNKTKALNEKLSNAIDLLGKNIESMVNSRPLSKINRLMLQRFIYLKTMQSGSHFATIATGSESDGKIREDALTKKQTELTNMLTTFSNNGELKKNSVVKYIINDLCTSNNIKPDESLLEELENAAYDTPLKVEDKQKILSNLNILEKNIDPENFTETNEKTAFSEDLRELAYSTPQNFQDKIDGFIKKYLTKENLINASSVIIYKSYENRETTDATLKSFATAFKDNAVKADSGILANVRQHFISVVQGNKKIKSAINLGSLSTQYENDLVRPIANSLLGNSDVRTIVRLAASYAATKLGYPNKEAVYDAFKDPDLSQSQKDEIVREMTYAMQQRGLDPVMAKLLATTRLNQTGYDFFLIRSYNRIKKGFFNMVSDIKGIFKGVYRFFAGASDAEKQLKIAEYHEYLPAMQNLVNRLDQNEARYVTRNSDTKFTVSPVAEYDKIHDTDEEGLSIAKLKASLTISNESGLIISRDQSGKISLSIKSDILQASLDVEATGAKQGVNGITVGAGIKGGATRILDLKFNSDDEAAAFLCKVFTCQLTEQDLRLASEAATGKSYGVGAQAVIRANIGEIIEDWVFKSEKREIDKIEDKDTRKEKFKEYEKNHPFLTTLKEYVTFGNVFIIPSAMIMRKTVADNTGTTTTTQRKYSFVNKSKIAQFTFSKNKLDYTKDNLGVDKLYTKGEFAQYGINTINKSIVKVLNENGKTSTAEKYKNKIKSTENTLDKVNKLGSWGMKEDHTVEYEKIIHRSAGKKIIDEAVVKETHNNITYAQIDKLLEEEVITKEKADILKKLTDKGKISKFVIIRKLKPEIVEQYKNDKEALEKAIDNEKDNFYLSDVIIESPLGQKTVEANEDWLNLVSGGYISYKVKAQSNANNVLHLQMNNFGKTDNLAKM